MWGAMMKPLKSAFGALTAPACADTLMLVLACSVSGTLSIESRPNESCKFVSTNTGEAIKHDKLIFLCATVWKAICENTPLPMGDPSKGRVVMLNSPDSMKVEGNTTANNDATFLSSGYELKCSLQDGTLTLLYDD
jgi:hypothetical protein